MGYYLQGNGVVVDYTFYRDIDGVATPTDPTTVTFKVRDPEGTLTTYVFGVAAEVTNPSEGVYLLSLGAPLPPGRYLYRVEGTGAVLAADDDFFIVTASPVLETPTVPPVLVGPCNLWVEGDDIVAAYGGDDPSIYTNPCVEASELLFELSGRQYNGGCQQAVRPCSSGCGCWGAQAAAGGGPIWWWGIWPGGGNVWGWWPGGCAEGVRPCGCGSLSRVKLSGYPVTEIVSVTVGGDDLPEFDGTDSIRNWRLDGDRWLTRMADPNDGNPILQWWPACQNLALDADQPGTFEVVYKYGIMPPRSGWEAAKQLAYEISKLGGGDCALPDGVTKLQRQGVTIERGLFTQWGRNKAGVWSTGLSAVDGFLNGFNPNGLRRRPAVWGPDTQGFAKKLGV